VLTRVNCSLPFPIASDISLQKYNSFVESEDISGCKLDYKKGTVYIVELCSTDHEAVVEIIGNYFRAISFTINTSPSLNTFDALNDAPIQIRGQPCKEFLPNLFDLPLLIVYVYHILSKVHDAPDGTLKAPDLAVYPHHTYVPDPPVPHPGPPPSDKRVLLICHVFFVIL
jgi:hypothetical protein